MADDRAGLGVLNVGIVGRARTGKDTIAEHLVRRHGYARVGLADPLKRLALVLDPIVSPAPRPKLARFSRLLDLPRKPLRLAELVERDGWENAKDSHPEVRRTLQRLGTDVIREHLGADTWVRLAVELIREHNAAGRSVVIPDVRFGNEVTALRELVGARLVRVRRAAAPNAGHHVSELLADTLPVDHEIGNDSTVPALLARVDTTIRTFGRNPAE